MTPKSEATASISLPWSFGPALVAAGAGATVMLVGLFLVAFPDLVRPVALAGGAVLAGTLAGWVAVVLAAGVRHMEPGFVVLGASIFRATVAVLAGLLLRGSAPAQPFWLSFLFVILCVIAAEVVISRRALEPAGRSRS